MWFLGSQRRRRRLAEDAAEARSSRLGFKAALGLVIVYNFIGVSDIASTAAAIHFGFGEEANPLLRFTMDHAGAGWVAAKLALQGVISAMVLWFPHWIVLGFFTLAMLGNAWIVYNNFLIAGWI